MAWLNDFTYVESKKFECEDGVHDMCIRSAVEKTSKAGARMIEVSCAVRDSNGVLYRTYIVEGDYFDNNLSRLMDCFGIPHDMVNPADWVNKVGRGRFDHNGKDKDKDGNERTNVLRCVALLPKSSAEPQQPTPANYPGFTPKATPTPAPINNGENFPEDIPF